MQKNHVHQWAPRTAYAKPGYYVTGYVCSCGRKDYVDLIKGVPDVDESSQRLQREIGPASARNTQTTA